jgi:signal transduction histidine kinase
LTYSGLFHRIHHHLLLTVPLWLFVFISLYRCVFLIYFRQRSIRSRPEAGRLTYLFYGGIGAVTLAATDFLPKAGLAFPTLGNILTVIYMYFISQTLFHFRLLDIKELLGKMVTLTSLVLILTIIYGLLLSWVGPDRPGVFFFNTLVASFVILVIFEQLRTWVEDRVNQWMFREKYEFSRRLQLLRQDLANIIEVGVLVRRILSSLEASERITHASIYLSDPAGANFRLTGHVGPRPIDHLEGTIRHLFLERLKEIGLLSVEALDRERAEQTSDGQEDTAVATRNIMTTMEDMFASICIPMTEDNQVLGILNLRDDRLREAYASDELNGLRKLAAQAAITLRNSKLYEQMKERDRLAALGQMAAGLAHEIRNPLGAIKGAAQLLKSPTDQDVDRDAPDTEEAEYKEIIVEEVNRLDRVVSQFLGYARPDRGERQVLNINDILHKTVQLLRSQADGVNMAVELAPNLPQVKADPEQLQQVFLNLGINGLQAMPDGGTLRVSTRRRRGSKRGRVIRYIEISFEDTGKGISRENLSDIFIPFYTTKENGTGLGLPICQRIIENHGGTIEVHSEPEHGSTFYVLLPSADDLTGSHSVV